MGVIKKEQPVQPTDLIGSGDPVTMEFFKTANKVADTEFIPKSYLKSYSFNPHAPEFEYIDNPTPATTDVDYFNSLRQSNWTKAIRAGKQFGANVASSIGQGLANTFDLVSLGKTIKGEVDGSHDDFKSSLFGISTKDMQDWSNGIEERNKIFERNPNSFNPGDFGWWSKQFASAGTGVGMAIEALGTTVAIEAATGGAGTEVALGKLASLFSRAKNANILKDGLDIASGLKSAATLYGTLSRYSESRMEAQNTYDEIYRDLDTQKGEDGRPKFNESEKKYIASQGARRDFNWNLALLPLDILAYRTMVFNPVSGSATGFLERGLEKIGNKALRKGTQAVLFSGLEGIEEGFQQVGQDEGLHYAKVLSGLDDSKGFLERFSNDVKSDDFWNNFAGGVIGSPIIGGVMHMANKAMTGNRSARMNEVHKDYVQNIAKMDENVANRARAYETNNETDKASVLRRQFNANKALSALHLDALTDKNSAFDAHKTFISGVLDELGNDKTDALTDLGFVNNNNPDQLNIIKKEFESYLKDANEIEGIYDNLKDKYNKNFLPVITQQHFQLNRLLELKTDTDTKLATQANKLYQYGDLSGFGKEIYNIEYQLQALQAEKYRLQELHKSTTDELEKANVQDLIESNKTKISSVSDRLGDIEGNEEYTDKASDNSILRSALRDREYLGLNYSKERLGNEVSLQRKNISLWNSPEYIASKNKQSISKANTKTQVEATEENISNTKQDTPEVKQSLQEKKDELATREAVDIIDQQKASQQQAATLPLGNGNLFADDNNLIETIKQESSGIPYDDEKQPDPAKVEYLFSPQEFDFNKSPDEAKNKIINGVRGLIEKIGDNKNFENLVRHVIKIQGTEVADNIFNAMKYGWENNNMPKEDYQAIYDKVFGSPVDELLDGVNALVLNSDTNKNKTVINPQQETEKLTNKIVATNQGFDSNNQQVVKYTGYVTNEHQAKFAFSTRLSELIQTKNDDGTITVSHDYTSDELNAGDYVNSLPLLDPDGFNEGTAMVIRIPDNFNEIKIPVYNEDGTKGKSVTFGQYVAMKNLSPQSQEYKDKIPMILYRKGAPTTEKGVAFVHDIGWYHPLRFNQDKKEDMDIAIANTRDIRKAVIDSSKSTEDVVITGKRQTTFAGLKTKNTENVTLKEANPQTRLTVALTTDSLNTSTKNTLFPNNDTVLINNSPFTIGAIYDVRRYGNKDGVKSYIALPILRDKLDDSSRTSVLQAITIYGTYNNIGNTNKELQDKYKSTIDNIKSNMGMDILSPAGLEQYLSHFIYVFRPKGVKTDVTSNLTQVIERAAANQLPAGTPFITLEKGQVIFGQAGVKQTATTSSYFINPKSDKTFWMAGLTKPVIVNGVKYPTLLHWYEQNLDLDAHNRNKTVVGIDKSFGANVLNNNYNDFLLDRFKTNLKSHNIGTTENPNYVTNIQPVITYDLKSRFKQTLPTNDEVKNEIISEDNTIKESKAGEESIEEIKGRILEQAKKDLGNDFGISKRSDLAAPAELTEEQRKVVSKNINRIAGLTPDQQFDIVDFMYNQITSVVNLDNKLVTKKEVDKHVENAFKDILIPLRKDYNDKISSYKTLINDHPELKDSEVADVLGDYQYRVAKINNIEESFDILKEEAYNRIAKYTGITQSKLLTEQFNDEENVENNSSKNDYNENEPNSRERDFWTDVFEENPEDRLSYSMRRFFGQIREYNKDGTEATGFLGLPTYTGADQIIRTLMVTLADIPSDFDMMMDKLTSRKSAIPWMQEAINKLSGASKQKKKQFVTVMSNTSVRPKFTMITLNQRTGTWRTKIYDTALNGVASAVKSEWKANSIQTDLILVGDEGSYIFNGERAKALMNQFDNWKGVTLSVIETDMNPWRLTIDKVKLNKPNTLIATGSLLTELKKNLHKAGDRMKFSLKGQEFQVSIEDIDSNKYKIEYLKQGLNYTTTEGKQETIGWLAEFGIILSNDTVNDLLTNGLLHNYKYRKPHDLFTTNDGLFQILYNRLKSLKDGHSFTEEGDNLLDDSVITSLANLEAQYNESSTPFGYRDGKKSLFALSLPKYITDRARELKLTDSETVKQLKSISFSKNSLWLKLLDDPKFRTLFNVSHLGLTAFKQQGKKVYRDNGIQNLSDLDHELTKLGMFWDDGQGKVSYNYTDSKGNLVESSTYPGTSINMRMGTMFSPTMSDKKVMTVITTAVLALENKDLLDGNGISDDLVKVLYEQLVRPELQRIIKFHKLGGATNVQSYDIGARQFLLLPELNNIEYTRGLKLIDAIKNAPDKFNEEYIEGNEDLMKAFSTKLREYTNSLVQEKIQSWENSELISRNEDENDVTPNFFDRKYIEKFRGDGLARVKMAAADFVINSLVANSNSFMLMAGDPALFYKSKSDNFLDQSKDTFVNIGKRLALLIAPGTSLANSENEKYLQVFLNDRTAIANNIEYLESILGKEGAAPYRSIKEGSDAQEYTTWKEHLHILESLGKIPDNQLDVSPEDIQEARDIFAKGTPKSKLSKKQLEIIKRVMQPIKPVYSGQVYDPKQDLMRTMYIKSSSFPLIPQLTKGLEIDKLRLALEKLENDNKFNVRASYQSANKVGALNNPIEIWDNNGDIIEDSLKDLSNSTLLLDRKNFRIQQEVPFKSAKIGDDTITLGTQLVKLIFGDDILKFNGFSYQGKTLTGLQLHEIYVNTFDNLVKEKKNQLLEELNLNVDGTPKDINKSMIKLQSILKDEANKRGYPMQDIEGLTLNKDGEFDLPLWASSNSNRYESMLNSIVSNRILRMKFPGNSFPVGSEEGFKTKVQEEALSEQEIERLGNIFYEQNKYDDDVGKRTNRYKEDLRKKNGNKINVDESRIIYTSSWNGKNLEASYFKDGKLKSAQVMIASKFKNPDGELVNLFTQENGVYKYVDKTENGWRIKGDMFDKELFSLTSFRIPTSGLSSASQIEIVGILPYESGDLMIVPKNLTKQKGLDFDIDKENSYQLWHYMTDEGKFEVLSEKHRNSILSRSDRILKDKTPESDLLAAIFGSEFQYDKEDLEGSRFLTKLNSKITEKIYQNDIIGINKSVLTNPDENLQAKITRVLNTDFSDQQATFIDDLVNTNKNNLYWTPLSDEYQKQKMFIGASGRIGTGAYALDTTFHSLAQQANLTGRPLRLIELVETEENEKPIPKAKIWRFGNRVSYDTLGGSNTVDGKRTISDRLNEAAQVAVDNEKLQIMGRVGLNDFTLDVDKIFNLTGLDRGSDGNSISYLFLSQPIIREYVDKMRNANSTMVEYSEDKIGDIVDGLLEKYDPATDTSDPTYEEAASDLMTNENFVNAIKSENPDGKLQGAVLRRFIDMNSYGKAIRSIQTSINADSKGLGKSFFDVIEKRNNLNRLGRDTDKIIGASNLIGNYELKEYLTEDEQKELVNQQGFVDIGEFLVKPNTVAGSFNINGIGLAYDLWSKFFPYDAAVTQKAFTEVMGIIGSKDMEETRVIELKQDIFKGIKKYFSASKVTGIISPEDDINEERRRLYIDSEDNISLASYIKSLKQIEGNEAINQYIKSNKLINRFEFDIQKNGQPSLIKFNNATGEEFDEQYLYESLATLIEARGRQGRIQLPRIGNKEYTLDTLAQDLIAYSYLGNSIQEAVQFTKYVPTSYLNTVGYSAKLRRANLALRDDLNILGIRLGNPKTQAHLVSEFTMQYVQHNPEKVRGGAKFNYKEIGKYIIKGQNDEFVFKDGRKPTFISVYDPTIPKGEKKFKLYWFDGEKYSRISVLGTFGMDEYQPRNTIGKSLVNGRVRIKINPQAKTNEESDIQPSLFNIEAGDTHSIISNIANSATPYAELAKHLLPFVGDINIVVDDIPELGLYNRDTNIITISDKITSDPDKLAQIVLHELVHGLTSKAITPYMTTAANPEVKPDAPSYVVELVRLLNNARLNFKKEDIDKIRDLVKNRKGLDSKQRDIYGLTDMYEFISEALTNKEFQKILNSIPYRQSGKSLLDKFKEVIKNVLAALGVKFDENYTAAHAISNIFSLIEESNKTNQGVNPYEMQYEESVNEDEQMLINFNKLMDDPTDSGIALSPEELERNYINNSTDVNTDKAINQYAFPADVGAYIKFIEFKRAQALDLDRRLDEITRKKRVRGITKEELTKLNTQEREIKLHLEGSPELGIKGLSEEIAELEKDPTIEAVGYYVEKDLKRLDKLSKSNDIDDLAEADKIIHFYTLAGTFESGIENPFFTQEEIFLEGPDGKPSADYRLSDTVMQKFKDWKDLTIESKNKVEKRKTEITVNQVNSNLSVIKTYGKDKEFTFRDLTNADSGLKDTDIISMWTMDVTSGIFSTNGILPQVMFSYLTNSFEKKLAWARKVEEKIDKINPGVQKELIKLGHSLRGVGLVGLKGASYNLFKEKTKDGHETGGLIQKFVKEFFDTQNSTQHKFQEAYKAANLFQDYTMRNAAYNKAFEDRKRWRRTNTIIIDPRQIQELTGDAEFIHLIGSNNTQFDSKYSIYLKSILGQKEYDNQIEKQRRLLSKYLTDKQSIIDTILIHEGKTNINDVSDKAKNELALWEINRNPLKGIEDHKTVAGIFHSNRKTNNYTEYNVFVPRKYKTDITVDNGEYKFNDTNELTGHYSPQFETIENNKILSEFYDVMKEVCETIRENMPYELQKKIPVNTVPALLKTSSEIIADKNTGILNAMFSGARALWDKLRLDFGVIRQSDVSYATLDPVTGRANYKVNDTFIRGNSRAVEERMLIEKTRFIQSYNAKAPQDEKINKLLRFSTLPLSKLKTSNLIQLAEYLDTDISEADISAGRIQSIRDRTGENVEIGRIIRDYAVHSVVQSQSFDLAKIGKYYSNLIMSYAARQEALPILEIMKKHYEDIRKPQTNNLGKGIYNANSRENEMAGLRTHAIKQMDDWFERVVLDNYGAKHTGELGREIRGKKIPVFGKTIFSVEERKKFEEINKLLENETDPKKIEELQKIKDKLGKVRTATALFDNLWSWIRTMRLGYNLSSATTNFMEGVTSNMILAADGSYFDSKHMFYGYSIIKSSFLKNVSFGKLETGLARKNRKLMDKFNVIMDSKNELQKSSIKSYASKLSWLNPHELNQRVEYINQSPIMIAMLRTEKIKDKSGKESSIWDAFNNNGHLKDEFKTEENTKSWEELSGEQYLNFKQKLHKVIVLGHGNYDQLRGMMIKSSTAGRAVAMFKTWIPMQLYWRLAVEQDDLQAGTKGFKGRYWSFGTGSAAIYGAAVGTALFGPLGIGVMGAVGGLLGAGFGTDSGVGMLQESVEATKQLFKKMIGMPVNLLAGRQIIGMGAKDFDKFIGKGDFTEQDAKNMRSNMSDIVLQLAWLGMILAVKGMFWDDDDKPEDAERKVHNVLVNKLMQLSSQGAMYVNPVDVYGNTVGSNAVVQYLTDVGKELTAVNGYLHGEDIILSGVNAGESKLGNQTYKTFMPGIFKSLPTLGFESQAERVFEESPFHRYFKSGAKIDREDNQRDRSERRLELEHQLDIEDYEGDTRQEKLKAREKEIRGILDAEYPTPSRLKKLDMTRDEFEEEKQAEKDAENK